jgi:hypothetical protein
MTRKKRILFAAVGLLAALAAACCGSSKANPSTAPPTA